MRGSSNGMRGFLRRSLSCPRASLRRLPTATRPSTLQSAASPAHCRTRGRSRSDDSVSPETPLLSIIALPGITPVDPSLQAFGTIATSDTQHLAEVPLGAQCRRSEPVSASTEPVSSLAIPRIPEIGKSRPETEGGFRLKTPLWRHAERLRDPALAANARQMRAFSSKTVACLVLQICLAGAPGFEPGNGGIKIHCLTTWRRPIRRPDHSDFAGRALLRPHAA